LIPSSNESTDWQLLKIHTGNLLRKGKTSQTDSPSRVLLVEDFEDLRKLVAFYLNARGYQVLEAANARAAIQSAKTGNPNFILLDFRLPDINGVELARQLRKLPQIENIPIVGWSADSGSSAFRDTLRRAGIVEYLQKPIRLKDLDAMIERFLPR
jgi:two-component system phosphate regulon response regulator PhoB